jgi:hypothetical protein
MSARLKTSIRENAMKTIGALCFFAGTFFLALTYTMALNGMYVDCFGGGEALCTLRSYGEPTALSASYGSLLALAAFATYHIGLRTLRAVRAAAARAPA